MNNEYYSGVVSKSFEQARLVITCYPALVYLTFTHPLDCKSWVEVVAQLVERPEVHGSNPVIGKTFILNIYCQQY